jgi:hypothetical protein
MIKIAVAIVLGIVAGIVDFRNDEVQATVLLVFLGSFVMGYVDSKKAWLYAIIIGGGVFVIDGSLPLFGFVSRSVAQPNIFATLIAVIPAMIGAYTGVLIKYLFSSEK